MDFTARRAGLLNKQVHPLSVLHWEISAPEKSPPCCTQPNSGSVRCLLFLPSGNHGGGGLKDHLAHLREELQKSQSILGKLWRGGAALAAFLTCL